MPLYNVKEIRSTGPCISRPALGGKILQFLASILQYLGNDTRQPCGCYGTLTGSRRYLITLVSVPMTLSDLQGRR